MTAFSLENSYGVDIQVTFRAKRFVENFMSSHEMSWSDAASFFLVFLFFEKEYSKIPFDASRQPFFHQKLLHVSLHHKYIFSSYALTSEQMKYQRTKYSFVDVICRNVNIFAIV